ncbi:MAG: hypothetical protein LUC93_00275 [Planctomycetaceae bacterium]|nr:hypothetical protein [Planctomycetaceae bacterium]
MLRSLNDARNAVLFPATASDFTKAADAVLYEINAATQSDKTAAVQLAADLALDLGSYLSVWVLEDLVGKDAVAAMQARFEEVVKANGAADIVAAYTAEKESIAASQTMKMCQHTREGKLFDFWGHDYCTGMDHSLRRGARFVTSNPAKINLFRKENAEIWAKLLGEAKAENPGASVEKIISAMFVKVTAINARVLKPIYDATDGQYGFVCVQTNPKNIGPDDDQKMVDEVLYWQEAYVKELGYQPINVVYKLPAVKGAVKAAEALVAKGIRICMTLNFSVSQHEIFAEIIQKGEKKGFVVIMAGFLDDNVAKELEAMGIENPKQYSKWAGVSVLRKSYANLRAKGLDKATIMAAAIRGPYTIEACLTDHADAPVVFTTMTEKIKEFDQEPRALKSEMEDSTPADVMEVLNKSTIFVKAYNRDKLDMDSVHDFVPLQAVSKVFTEAYTDIEKSLA